MSAATALDPDLERTLTVLKNRAENLARTLTQIGMTNPTQWRETLATFTAATQQLTAIREMLKFVLEDSPNTPVFDNLALYPHTLDEYFAHIPDQLRSRLDPTMENEDRMLVDSVVENEGFSPLDSDGVKELRRRIYEFDQMIDGVCEIIPLSTDEFSSGRSDDIRVEVEDGPEPLRALQNAIYRGDGLIPVVRVSSRGPTPAPISRQPTPNPAQYGSGPMASAGVGGVSATSNAAPVAQASTLPHVAVASSAPSRTVLQQQQQQQQQQQAFLAQQQHQQQQQQLQQQQYQQSVQAAQQQQQQQAQQVAAQKQQQLYQRQQMLQHQQQQQQIQAQQQQQQQMAQQQPPGMSLLQQPPSRTAPISSVRFTAPQQQIPQGQHQHQLQAQMQQQQQQQQQFQAQQQQQLRMKLQAQQQSQQQQLQHHQQLMQQQQQQRAAGGMPKISMPMTRPGYPPQPK